MRILLLDDDVLVLRGLEKALRRQGYEVCSAPGAAEAIALARDHLFDLVVCDVRMPGVDGLEALETLRRMQQGVRSIVITGFASEDAPVRAIKNQVDDYLFKPFALEDLLRSVRHSLELQRLEREGRHALERLRRRYLQVIATLVGTFQDDGHSRRVAALAADMGEEMGLGPAALDRLELAGLLHDLGLAWIDREILRKAEALTAEERDQLRSHPLLARGLLEQVPDLREILPILSHHHEWFDGRGYPHGLAGEAIPLESRILAAAEAWDSLTHDRPHRPALAPPAALEELRSSAGAQFDPAVVEVLARVAGESGRLADPAEILSRSGRAAREQAGSLVGLAHLFGASGDEDSARQACAEARRVLGPDPEQELWLDAEEALLEARAGSPAARERAEAAAARWEALPAGDVRVARTLGRALAHLDLPERAAAVLRRGIALGDRVSAHGARTQLLALGFMEELDRWLDEVPPGWLEGLSLAERRETLPVLVRAAREGLRVDRVRQAVVEVVKGFPLLADWVRERLPPGFVDLAPDEGEPRPALQVQCLGPLRVQAAERSVPPSAWMTRKAQELFVYLLLHERPVSADALAEALWPDSDTARKILHTTVSRVRRALRAAVDGPVLVGERNFYYLEPGLSLWVDAREFDRLAATADLDGRGALAEEALLAGQRALDLYGGDFLEGIWEPWTDTLRTGWRERLFALLARLAAHHEALGQWARAEDLLRRALQADPCREEAWLGLMRCAVEQGQRDLAARRYQDYRRVLEQELGLEPSPEAQEFARRL